MQLLSINIRFGKVTRFAEGKGVLIPALKENSEFHRLRKVLLKNVTAETGFPEAHITLMHPRNSTCTDKIFRGIQKAIRPQLITFTKVSLIEQINGRKWKIKDEFPLLNFR